MSFYQNYTLLKKASEDAIKETQDMGKLSSEILEKIVIETIRKYQQKIGVGIEDCLSDLLDSFKEKIAQEIFSLSSEWRAKNKILDHYFLFPRGCRFCFCKGDNTVVVIEQEPQVRSLLLHQCILNEQYESNFTNAAERLALALPYVVFVLQFKDDKFTSMYCGWRTAPLRDIEDQLCAPILPNMHENLNVCMGAMVNNTHIDICSQTEMALNHFWNSKFNNDLSEHWWRKSTIDCRIKDARTWSENSIENSLFILEANLTPVKKLEDIINLLTKNEIVVDQTQFTHVIKENIDQCLKSLFIKVSSYLKKTKFEKFEPKDIRENLQKIMLDANQELSALVLTIKNELETLHSEIRLSNSKPTNYPKSQHWQKYSNE